MCRGHRLAQHVAFHVWPLAEQVFSQFTEVQHILDSLGFVAEWCLLYGHTVFASWLMHIWVASTIGLSFLLLERS